MGVKVHVTGHTQTAAKRATIRDIAARAGVSHQTVSRVINGHDSVAADTRARVHAVIRELGYVPSPLARGLTSNRTHSLGMVTDDVSDHFFARAVAGAEAEARRRGYYLMIASVELAPHDDDDARGYLRLMLERRVEGLIVAGPMMSIDPGELLPAESAGVPVVVLGAGELPGLTVVDVDNERGGFDATSFLVGEGHHEIATIVGPEEWPSAAARLDGYRAALREAGLSPDPALLARARDWGLDAGQKATAELLERGVRFTALFAHSDLIALGAIRTLRLAGLRVPDDVSVVGYDDQPIAAFVEPPLTTVHQPTVEVGELAAGLVLDRLASGGPQGPTTHLLPAALVVRDSVRPR